MENTGRHTSVWKRVIVERKMNELLIRWYITYNYTSIWWWDKRRSQDRPGVQNGHCGTHEGQDGPQKDRWPSSTAALWEHPQTARTDPPLPQVLCCSLLLPSHPQKLAPVSIDYNSQCLFILSNYLLYILSWSLILSYPTNHLFLSLTFQREA